MNLRKLIQKETEKFEKQRLLRELYKTDAENKQRLKHMRDAHKIVKQVPDMIRNAIQNGKRHIVLFEVDATDIQQLKGVPDYVYRELRSQEGVRFDIVAAIGRNELILRW